MSSSSEYANQYVLSKTNKILTNEIKGINYKITDGKITGLVSPLLPTDAVNKEYADTYISSNTPQNFIGPSGAIQYTQSNTFYGDNNLKWNGNSLITPSISDGIAIWNNNTIKNLFNPEEDTQIATKNYTDPKFDIVNITNNTNITYTPSQCINTIIFRNTLDTNVTDLTPLASEWETTELSIKNVSTNGIVKIVPNLNVKINFNLLFIQLYPNYQVNMKILKNNNEIFIFIMNITFLYSNSNTINEIFSSNAFYTKNAIISSKLLYRAIPTYITNDYNITYSIDTLLNGYIIRTNDITSDKTDSLVPLSTFLFIVPFLTIQEDDNPTPSAGFQFKILNKSNNFSITLNTSNNGWTSDLSNITTIIGPNKMGIFGLSILNSIGYIYTIGIY